MDSYEKKQLKYKFIFSIIATFCIAVVISASATFYYVTGINAPYTKPEFTDFPAGLTNLIAISAPAKDTNGVTFINNGQVIDVPGGETGNAAPDASETVAEKE